MGTNILTALITGAAGFVGTAIVHEMVEHHPECSITALDIRSPSPGIDKYEHVEFIEGDVTDLDNLKRIFDFVQPVVVIHAAGLVPDVTQRYGRQMEEEVQRVNVQETQNVLEAAQSSGVSALVYTSSCCSVTDDFRQSYAHVNERWPTSKVSLVYGESKAAAEALVLSASDERLGTCVLRPSVLCGPGDNQLIPLIHACIMKRETPYIVGDGLNLWDITYVENVAMAHRLAVQNLLSNRSAAGEAFFIQNNEPIPFRAFQLAIWAHFGHTPPFELRVPRSVAWLAGAIADCVSRITGAPTTLSLGSVSDAVSVRYASGDKARLILGYEPRVGIEEGIRLGCESDSSEALDLSGMLMDVIDFGQG